MTEPAATPVRESVEAIYRADSRRVLATLIRLLRDFDLAEEAMHEAFAAAVEQWPRDGVPDNPRAWLVSTGRFKAIDRIRRRARFDVSFEEIAEQLEDIPAAERDGGPRRRRGRPPAPDLHLLPSGAHAGRAGRAHAARSVRTHHRGDRARLPGHAVDDRAAHRARQVEDPGRAHPVRSAGPHASFPDRLDSVLRVIYLVFNEGYLASSGGSLTRHDLSGEAIRLGRLLVELLPEPEAVGLLALMLLHDARRAARTSESGELVLLDEQDRSLWNRAQIADASRLVEGALSSRGFGAYTLQAAIAALHAEAPSTASHRLGADRRALRRDAAHAIPRR